MKNLLGLGHDVRTLTDMAKALLRGFAEEIFHTHFDCMLSWEGDYGLDDMLVIDGCQFIIIKKPSFVFEAAKNGPEWSASRVKDIHRLEELFTPAFDGRKLQEQIGAPGEKDLPLFYDYLRHDLRDVTEEEVGQR
jgi:hypothetical protein